MVSQKTINQVQILGKEIFQFLVANPDRSDFRVAELSAQFNVPTNRTVQALCWLESMGYTTSRKSPDSRLGRIWSISLLVKAQKITEVGRSILGAQNLTIKNAVSTQDS